MFSFLRIFSVFFLVRLMSFSQTWPISLVLVSVRESQSVFTLSSHRPAHLGEFVTLFGPFFVFCIFLDFLFFVFCFSLSLFGSLCFGDFSRAACNFLEPRLSK